MSNPKGFNPMRWDCENKGCFNRVKRPKVEQLCESLPRDIAFTDIDGTVEVNGHFLFLEWKMPHAKLTTGQKIYFNRLTNLSEKIVVVVVYGDAETMDVDEIQVFHGNDMDYAKRSCDLNGLKTVIKDWLDWAEGIQ